MRVDQYHTFCKPPCSGRRSTRILCFPASNKSPILVWTRPVARPPEAVPKVCTAKGGRAILQALQNRLPSMTDPNSPSHWDELISTLGATPSPQEQESQQPHPTASPQSPPHKSVPRKSQHHQPAKAPSRPADWDMLASQLGVAPELPPTAPPAPSVAGPSPVVPPPLPEPSRRATPPPETPEESPNFFDERFDFEEPFDLLESSESPAVAAETTSETAEPTEKRHRRRRRRRRGRGAERRESPPAEAASGAPSTDLPSGSLADSDRESDAEQQDTVGLAHGREPSEAGESREQRSRRGRPRRGRHRRDTGAEAGGQPSQDRADRPAVKSHDADEAEADVFDDVSLEPGEGDQSDGAQPARLGFRGIPTWQEVVGLLIDKNIEARSKRPAGGPHHGRGNRGPRDNRGGQDGGKRRS
jgi:hypothetical protein